MVGVLIRLRRTTLAHGAQRVAAGSLVVAGVSALISAGGTLWLGITRYDVPGAGADLLAFVFALWIFGQCTQAAATGTGATLPPELFALLPVRVRSLAWGFLVLGVLEPGTVIVAGAFLAVVALGAHASAAAAVVGLIGWALATLLASVSATVCANLLASNARRGRDAGTVVTAVLISVVAVAGSLLPALAHTLTRRSSPALTHTVRALPSGWAAVAVDAAGRSDWTLVAVALVALAAVVTAVAALLPWLLARRMSRASGPAHRRRHRTHRRLLPGTPTGAVVSRELISWARDPIRLTCLIIAAIVGFGVSVVPYVTARSTALLPFGGLLAIVIAGACACNLYGNDGTSLWTLVMTPGSARPDVRGRVLAWWLVVAPWTIALTVISTAVSGAHWAWPWVLALLPALLGGGAGLALFASVHTVLPLDDAGGPTPAWSVKVHLALYAMLLTGALPAAVLTIATVAHSTALRWSAVPVGVATGLALARWLTSAAARRLDSQLTTILERLTTTGAVADHGS